MWVDGKQIQRPIHRRGSPPLGRTLVGPAFSGYPPQKDPDKKRRFKDERPKKNRGHSAEADRELDRYI